MASLPSGATLGAQIKKDIGAKAPIASPTFTGTPQAPTPAMGDNSKKIATTAFVVSHVKSVMSSSADVFRRPSLFTCEKRAVTIPAGMDVQIGSNLYTTTSAKRLTITDFGNVAGRDFYIYACAPSSGTTPVFVISQNSTVPTGYTAANSRKIGGFHTLCANAGTLTYIDSVTGSEVAHWLSGYVMGDILPLSCWDLWHRPQGDPEGYVYVGYNNQDVWESIYLLSWDGTKLVSKFGAATADGASSKKFHGELFSEALAKQNCRLPWRDEFVWAARGCNEQTNIKGSADVTTTGGHVDTAGRRMISNVGCEDTCGFLWQWLRDTTAWGTEWQDNVYASGVDPCCYGRNYGSFRRALAGGYWPDSSCCGSRSSYGSIASSIVNASFGARGASEPLHERALVNTGYPI